MAKTTFRVDRKRWDLFNRECKASFLRRDAYLNHTLPAEIDLLERLPPNDDDGHQWLKNTWFGKDGALRGDATDFVSVMLEKPLIDRLNQACNDRLIPRDSFIHCFLMFLTERLVEPVIVIKNPRTTDDTFWQVAEQCHVAEDQEAEGREEDDVRDDLKDQLLCIGQATRTRNLAPLRLDYYERELSFPPEKLAAAKKDKDLLDSLLLSLGL